MTDVFSNVMPAIRWFLVLVCVTAAVVFVSCSSNERGQQANGTAIPAEFKRIADVPDYPGFYGAVAYNSVGGNYGTLIRFKTNDTLQNVIDFFQFELTKRGWKQDIDNRFPTPTPDPGKLEKYYFQDQLVSLRHNKDLFHRMVRLTATRVNDQTEVTMLELYGLAEIVDPTDPPK